MQSLRRPFGGRTGNQRRVKYGSSYFAAISEMGVHRLRKAGMKVDPRWMDVLTMLRRRTKKEIFGKGGWNVCLFILDGMFGANPATNAAIHGHGKSEFEGLSSNMPRFQNGLDGRQDENCFTICCSQSR
jgi:hypothetical protein